MQTTRVQAISRLKEQQRQRDWRFCLGGSLLLALTLLILFWPSQQAGAHQISRQECSEGSEFIRNAALSRDNGETREAYLAQLQGDLVVIRAFPPELRWFAQDEADEALLVSAASEVFDDPHPPEHHRQAFLDRCLGNPAHNS